MERPEPDFTADDLLSQLQAEMARTDDAWAMSELVAALGWSRAAIGARLDILIKEGRVDILRKRIVDRTGRLQTVAAYRLRREE